jgi:hypothetical protein
MEKKIIQLSDLYFSEYKFFEELKINLKMQIMNDNPDFNSNCRRPNSTRIY